MTVIDKLTIIPAVYIFLRKQNDVLLIRRHNTGFRDGWYSLPAGHVDGGKSAKTAAARELLEEVGVIAKLSDINFAHVIHRVAEEHDHERVDFFFEATKWQGEPTNMEPEKCDYLGWFPLDSLPEKTAPIVLGALEHVANGSYYSDSNFD